MIVQTGLMKREGLIDTLSESIRKVLCQARPITAHIDLSGQTLGLLLSFCRGTADPAEVQKLFLFEV